MTAELPGCHVKEVRDESDEDSDRGPSRKSPSDDFAPRMEKTDFPVTLSGDEMGLLAKLHRLGTPAGA